MRPVIVLTGGGSGGHVMPILAVARELKRRRPDARLIYVGQTGDRFVEIPRNDKHIDEVFTVRAGKFRRYHGEGWKQLLDFQTVFLNIRDIFYVAIGLWQSWRLMKRINPDVIFSRGGFVSVPVSLGGHFRHVPYITHDSDPVPSLANRLIAPWAARHAVSLPKETYPYPPEKTVTTGVPIDEHFVPVTDTLRKQYRREIDIPESAQLLFVIGGGLGSQLVNHAIAENLPHLLKEFPRLRVVHVTGAANEAEMEFWYDENLSEAEQGRVQVRGFLDKVYEYSGAADIIVCRAGATNLAEFAAQGKACVVIPSTFLTGGHQLKNAEYLAEQDAVLVIDESQLAADANKLAKQLSALLHDAPRQKELGANLRAFARPEAAESLAALILECIRPRPRPQVRNRQRRRPAA
ncbi:MAG TPA: UDP-N-acetylglucosamine--N-acetylmuramyl-(pentapeptide) pyrophosphoryl-undecaprenol N-acetylglucosamine transferase [Candidatus Saccharimonadales bacterium]|nr:UDP-N-acetylglucosamine--N-acetylmuramyl-(pentapeptide) pyrophosphoryl-undecaprenol N-acetylglucosamine transferase [Candidatus Saccharimonadales bacterium]